MYANPYASQLGRPVQFVNGPDSALQVPMAPNTQQMLMDRNRQRFYWVEADASGQKAVTAYDFEKAPQDGGVVFGIVRRRRRGDVRHPPRHGRQARRAHQGGGVCGQVMAHDGTYSCARTKIKQVRKRVLTCCFPLVDRQGFEPWTLGLRVDTFA